MCLHSLQKPSDCHASQELTQLQVLLQRAEVAGTARQAALASWCRVRDPLVTSCMLNQLICVGKWKKICFLTVKKFGVIFPGFWVELQAVFQ